MTEYLTEQEQIELLKNWIKQYSLVILTGVVIAVAAITGWRYWQKRETTILYHASSVYDEMLTSRAQNDVATTIDQAQKLTTHYAKTSYGELAALMLARASVAKKDFAAANQRLNWVIDHSKIASLRQIARLRLARMLISEQKADEAIKILSKVEDKSFAGLTDEVRGDAYLAQKDISQAKASYKQALAELPNAEVIRPLLQMKYDNLT